MWRGKAAPQACALHTVPLLGRHHTISRDKCDPRARRNETSRSG
jgi:hypothetical protein